MKPARQVHGAAKQKLGYGLVKIGRFLLHTSNQNTGLGHRKTVFWFEHSARSQKLFWFVMELAYNLLCYWVMCWAIKKLGISRNLWPFFPLYLLGFNTTSVVRVALRKRGSASAV